MGGVAWGGRIPGFAESVDKYRLAVRGGQFV